MSAEVLKRKVGGVDEVTLSSLESALARAGIGRIAEEIFGGAFVGVVGGHGDDGIGEDDEVGAAIFVVDGIGIGRVAGVEMGGEGGGEVAAGGEAHEAELRRDRC